MEVSSQVTKAEVRWRRQGIGGGGVNGAANSNTVMQQQQRIEALTRNLANAAVTEGVAADDETEVNESPNAGGANEDRLAPLPAAGRFSNADRRKSELKNRKTSTAVAAAAAGLKTLDGKLRHNFIWTFWFTLL